MSKQDNFIIISVESRKGGVGKTTVVLNLAKLLMDTYHVLVLDVDVTGTSINAIQNTSFWQKNVKLLSDEKQNNINLLQLFKDQYLLGNCNMRFSTKSEASKIRVYADSVNVMASELYSEDGSLLYDPSIIFDEIHDYWLLDMIRNIAHSFSEAFNDKKNTVVILDNSPGYVGLGKSIHDLLTDMGPLRGKFLSVSSLDVQDIDSCLKAVMNIHDLTNRKEQGASFYHGKESFTELKVGSIEQETFDRLAVGDEALSYYANPKLSASAIEGYQALVINRVPLRVKNGILRYQYNNKDNKILWNLFTTLCGDDSRSCMIPYDESIHCQFFKNNLTFSKSVEKSRYDELVKQIKSLKEKAHRVDMFYDKNEWRKIAYLLNSINRDMVRLPDSLNRVSMYGQASHINPDWYPESVFREMFKQLQDMELISNSRTFVFPVFFTSSSTVEPEIKLDYLSKYPRITCAVKAILAVLSYYFRQNQMGFSRVLSSIDDILNRLHKDRVLEMDGIDEKNIMAYVSWLMNDAYTPEQFFQVYFLNALVRVEELSEDVAVLCDSILLLIEDYYDSAIMTDVNFAWVLDERILHKKISSKQAQHLIRKEVAEMDYMSIVRQVVEPIIKKWGLIK